MTTGMTGSATGSGATPSGSGSAGSGTTGVAKEQAGQVASSAQEQAAGVAQTSAEQAKQVAAEAKTQARDLAGELKGQAQQQAGQQRDRLVGTLQSFGDDLEKMARGEGGGEGIAAEIARQVATRTRDVARLVETKQPSELLEDLQSFARRRPGAFLAGAAVLGVLAGRATRGAVSAAREESGGSARLSGQQAYAGGAIGGQESTRTPEPLTTVDPAFGAPTAASTIPPAPVDPAPVVGTGTAGWGETTSTGTTGGAGGVREEEGQRW